MERCDSQTIVAIDRVPVISALDGGGDGQLPVSRVLKPETAAERLQV